MEREIVKVLAVVAHPDDETIGCGATLARHSKEGDHVSVVTFTDGVGSRSSAQGIRDQATRRRDEYHAALSALGITPSPHSRQFSDQKLDSLGVLKLAEAVGLALDMHDPNVIYTHWHGDLNQDHRYVSEAVLIATRTQNRRKVHSVFAFEVPESTTQAFSLAAFTPNVFCTIDKACAARKMAAMGCYASESREWPHPRSFEGVEARLKNWGMVAGVDYAEAFVLLRQVR